MASSTIWNERGLKWLISCPKAKPIPQSLNLLRSLRLPASTDEADPISPSQSFFDLPNSAGGSLLSAAPPLSCQLHLSPPSRDQRKPSVFEVHLGAAEKPSHRQHHAW